MIEGGEYNTLFDEKTYLVTCDECGDELTLEAPSWADLIDQVKSEGWRITKEDGDWVHLCPDCR